MAFFSFSKCFFFKSQDKCERLYWIWLDMCHLCNMWDGLTNDVFLDIGSCKNAFFPLLFSFCHFYHQFRKIIVINRNIIVRFTFYSLIHFSSNKNSIYWCFWCINWCFTSWYENEAEKAAKICFKVKWIGGVERLSAQQPKKPTTIMLWSHKPFEIDTIAIAIHINI